LVENDIYENLIYIDVRINFRVLEINENPPVKSKGESTRKYLK
jgi:hypothetical protein